MVAGRRAARMAAVHPEASKDAGAPAICSALTSKMLAIQYSYWGEEKWKGLLARGGKEVWAVEEGVLGVGFENALGDLFGRAKAFI